MSYPKSPFSFHRTEIRVLREKYPDDEDFFNVLADIIGNLDQSLDEYRTRAHMAEARLNSLESFE